MLVRSLVVAALALVPVLSLTTTALAASPHLTAKGHAALVRLDRVANDASLVAAKQPGAAFRAACAKVAGRAPDQQAGWLAEDCDANADGVVAATALVACLDPDADALKASARCMRTPLRDLTAAARRAAVPERKLAAATTGACHAYFATLLTVGRDTIRIYGDIVDALVTGDDDALSAVFLQLSGLIPDRAEIKRQIAACKPA